MKQKLLFFLPAIIWFTIATILFTLPGSAFPQENWLDRIWADKWIHIGLFSVLSTLFCWAVYKTNTATQKNHNYFLVIALLCICYGTSIEFIQKYFIANRSFDVGDIIADSIGTMVGYFFSRRRYIKR